MTKVLLSVHVLAAILTIGPIAVAASVFPRFAREPGSRAVPGSSEVPGSPEMPGSRAIPAYLHRICRVYAVVGLAVPVFGVATGARLGVLTDAWLLTSIGLTVVAAALLALAILPGQRRLLAAGGAGGDAGRLGMVTGLFNLLWAVVVVLMIVRPGSTTGA